MRHLHAGKINATSMINEGMMMMVMNAHTCEIMKQDKTVVQQGDVLLFCNMVFLNRFRFCCRFLKA